jgi:hypothetical protein
MSPLAIAKRRKVLQEVQSNPLVEMRKYHQKFKKFKQSSNKKGGKQSQSKKQGSIKQVMISRGLTGQKEGSSRVSPLNMAKKNLPSQLSHNHFYLNHPLLCLCVLEACAGGMMKSWGYSAT